MKLIKDITLCSFSLCIYFSFSNFAYAKGNDIDTHKHHTEKKTNISEEKHDQDEQTGKHDEHEQHQEHNGHDEDSHDSHSGEAKTHDEHGDDEHSEGSEKVGKGKAIESIDEQKGFKLSKEAFKTIEIKLREIKGETFRINRSSLVISKREKGIYRFREGFFKFLDAEIIQKKEKFFIVKVKGIRAGDKMVIHGLGLLKIADVFSTDNSNYGHSH